MTKSISVKTILPSDPSSVANSPPQFEGAWAAAAAPTGTPIPDIFGGTWGSDVDWAGIWRDRMDLYRMSNGGCDCSRQWLDEADARKYWNSARETQQFRIRQTLSALDIGPESNVLDIGAGPGVLSLPLAGKAASVTAIDASPAMIRVLLEKAGEAGLTNIRCIARKWEDVDPEKDLSPPYDVVVASLALGMPDLDAALDKMERVCSGDIHLIWFAGEPTWEHKAGVFKRRFCGRPHFPAPKSDVVFNLLYQRGIYPCVHVIPYTHEERFASLDDAVAYFVRRYQIPRENRGPDLLDWVEGLLEGLEGRPVLRSRAVLMRMSWRAGAPGRRGLDAQGI